MLANILRRSMPRPSTLQRTRSVLQHMQQSTSAPQKAEASVLFESNGPVRRYILNRPSKLNALDETMISLLRPAIEEWEESELCRIIVGTGNGKAFCAGGDVEGVIRDGKEEHTRPKAVNFFKQEFELDYLLASVSKPYVAIMDGITMGGGVGLSVHAPFRIATEHTVFAMPETKIGYAPDVGANYFLSRLDGQLGTFLALSGNMIRGHAVFELGLATHYVPTRRIPQLLDQLASMDKPTYDLVNNAIEELYDEPLDGSPNNLTGSTRVALETAFSQNSVEEIITSLEQFAASSSGDGVTSWAEQTLKDLNLRSPTSLRIALEAVRRGKTMNLAEVLRMELGIATALLNGASTDFETGVTAVLIDKLRDVRPKWVPDSLSAVEPGKVKSDFFDPESPFIKPFAPTLELPLERKNVTGKAQITPQTYTLPTEDEISPIVRGTHRQSGGVALSVDEVVQTFLRMRNGKHGVEQKVREVCARCCVVEEDPDRHHCLRWKKKT